MFGPEICLLEYGSMGALVGVVFLCLAYFLLRTGDAGFKNWGSTDVGMFFLMGASLFGGLPHPALGWMGLFFTVAMLAWAMVRQSTGLEGSVESQEPVPAEHNAKLQTLTSISRILNRVSNLEEMLRTVLQQAVELYPYRRGYIAVTDKDTGRFRILASIGYNSVELADQDALVSRNEVTPAYFCVPLRATAGVIGFLCLDAEPPQDETYHVLHLLGDLLATTVEKYRLLEAAEREIRAQKLLNEAGRVLTSTLDQKEVLTRIMREAVQALDAEAGSVVLRDETRGDMFFAAAASIQADALIGTRMPLGQGIVGWTMEHGESVLATDASNDPRFYGRIDRQLGFRTRSIVCVPLFSKDKVIGAIEVMNSRRGHFTPDDLRLLESLSPQAAIAIENAFLFESVKTQMAELKRAQDQLLQAEKLSAIGRLVAGVAHELNNPLTAIVGYSQLLLETCTDQEICEDLERIHREAQRSARIVHNLLAFARQQKMEKIPIELNAVLEKTIDLLAYQLEVDNVTLIRELSPSKIMVMADNYQLQQVFVNIITNAHHAMLKVNGRGTLTIRSERVDRHAGRVYFIDDGPGIPPEIANRIFDPFFTTKDVGEGTGLGLSICLGIIQEHEGRIWLDEHTGAGATFVIELPLCEGPEQSDPVREDHVATGEPGPLDILVVDDEPEITKLLSRILRAEGHRVVTVVNGLEARDILDEQPFDVIICDLKMPGMNGRDLYTYLKQTNPAMARRVIFSTGDTVSEESWTFLTQNQNRYISKPFKPDQVLAEIQALFWT